MEMLHVMFKYPEVVTNIDFIKLSKIPLKLWLGVKVNSVTETEYGAYVVSSVESFHRSINIYDFRLHTENQLLILDYMKPYKILVDNVTQFGIRSPKLRGFSDKLLIIIVGS